MQRSGGGQVGDDPYLLAAEPSWLQGAGTEDAGGRVARESVPGAALAGACEPRSARRAWSLSACGRGQLGLCVPAPRRVRVCAHGDHASPEWPASHLRGWEPGAPRLLSSALHRAARSVLRERRRLCCAARPGAEGGDRPPPPQRTS